MSTVELILETDEQIAAGARSRAYALLAEAFGFPDAALAGRFASGEWLEEFGGALGTMPFHHELTEQAYAALSRPTEADLTHDYIRLFEVGAGRPFCPLYEGAHRGGRMKIMEELVRFFEHFGLRPAPGDQPDHLCAEFQFMHYLAFKEAASPSQDLRTAQRDFLYRHLCKWLPRLVGRLDDAREPSLFYSALASTAGDFCSADLAWLKGCQEIPDPQIGPLPD